MFEVLPNMKSMFPDWDSSYSKLISSAKMLAYMQSHPNSLLGTRQYMYLLKPDKLLLGRLSPRGWGREQKDSMGPVDLTRVVHINVEAYGLAALCMQHSYSIVVECGGVSVGVVFGKVYHDLMGCFGQGLGETGVAQSKSEREYNRPPVETVGPAWIAT